MAKASKILVEQGKSTFENYPFQIVLLSNIVSILTYLSGLYIMYRVGRLYSIVYLAFILSLEFRLIKSHCTDCYYWGRTCGFGKGRISSLFFKQGDSANFCNNSFSWKDMIPDLLVTLIPFVTGVILLIIDFDPVILAALILILVLTTAGNNIVRGKLTCNYCKQRELGCPADRLFNKGK